MLSELGFGTIIGPVAIGIVLAILLVRLLTSSKPNIIFYESEKSFIDPSSRSRTAFPNHGENEETSQIYLSVIVPAYNEEERLPKMLTEALSYLESRCNDGHEV